MPPIVLTEEEKTVALAKAGSDLRFLLTKEEVDTDLQAILYHVGVTTVSRFAALAETAEQVKVLCRNDMAVDSDADLVARVRVTKLLVAWKAAISRTTKVAEVEGEMESRRLTKPLLASDYSNMRRAFEDRWWLLDDKQTPSRAYLEKKLEGVEKDEPRAEALTEVTNREEGDDSEVLVPVWDKEGSLKVRRGELSVPAPINPEQLRRRVVLCGTAWIMVALKHNDRAWLDNLTPQLFQEYLDYLLGDFVWLLVARDSSGRTLSTPAFHQVVQYEHAIRREACRRVQKGEVSLGEALRAAWKDPVIKERYFTTPVALSALGDTASQRTSYDKAPPTPGRSYRPEPYKKGNGKGPPKGKGKGLPGCKALTSDGMPICYRYNNKDSKCSGKCRFAHVCGRCLGKHPMYQCSGNNSGPLSGETQGAA